MSTGLMLLSVLLGVVHQGVDEVCSSLRCDPEDNFATHVGVVFNEPGGLIESDERFENSL